MAEVLIPTPVSREPLQRCGDAPEKAGGWEGGKAGTNGPSPRKEGLRSAGAGGQLELTENSREGKGSGLPPQVGSFLSLAVFKERLC